MRIIPPPPHPPKKLFLLSKCKNALAYPILPKARVTETMKLKGRNTAMLVKKQKNSYMVATYKDKEREYDGKREVRQRLRGRKR